MSDKRSTYTDWRTWGPFRHIRGHIWAQNSPDGETMVFQVRGWGYLTGRGTALGMTPDEATPIMDDMGDTLAALLNERFPVLPLSRLGVR